LFSITGQKNDGMKVPTSPTLCCTLFGTSGTTINQGI